MGGLFLFSIIQAQSSGPTTLLAPQHRKCAQPAQSQQQTSRQWHRCDGGKLRRIGPVAEIGRRSGPRDIGREKRPPRSNRQCVRAVRQRIRTCERQARCPATIASTPCALRHKPRSGVKPNHFAKVAAYCAGHRDFKVTEGCARRIKCEVDEVDGLNPQGLRGLPARAHISEVICGRRHRGRTNGGKTASEGKRFKFHHRQHHQKRQQGANNTPIRLVGFLTGTLQICLKCDPLPAPLRQRCRQIDARVHGLLTFACARFVNHADPRKLYDARCTGGAQPVYRL